MLQILPSNFGRRGAWGAALKLVLRAPFMDGTHGQNEFARGTREVWTV